MTAIHFVPSEGRFKAVEESAPVAAREVPRVPSNSARAESGAQDFIRLLSKVRSAEAIVRELLSVQSPIPTAETSSGPGGVSNRDSRVITSDDLKNPAALAAKLEKILRGPEYHAASGFSTLTQMLLKSIARTTTSQQSSADAEALKKLLLEHLALSAGQTEILKNLLASVEQESTLESLLRVLRASGGKLPTPQTEGEEIFLELFRQVQHDLDDTLSTPNPGRAAREVAVDALESFEERSGVGGSASGSDPRNATLSPPFERAARQLKGILITIAKLPEERLSPEIERRLLNSLDQFAALEKEIRTGADRAVFDRASDLSKYIRERGDSSLVGAEPRLKSSLMEIMKVISETAADAPVQEEVLDLLDWNGASENRPLPESIKRLLLREPGAARVLLALQELPEEGMQSLDSEERAIANFVRNSVRFDAETRSTHTELPGRTQVQRILRELADATVLERGERAVAQARSVPSTLESKIDQIQSAHHFMQSVAPLLNSVGEPSKGVVPILIAGFLAKLQFTIPAGTDGAGKEIREDTEGEGQGASVPFERFQCSTELPNLGGIRIDLAFRPKEVILFLEFEREGAGAWVGERTPMLTGIFAAAGFSASITVR